MLQTFCEQEALLRLAYVDRQGFPRVLPLWFVLLDDAYYVGTGTTSPKWKAIQRDTRVGWSVDGGVPEHYTGASLYGRAIEVTDAATRARVYAALGRKYFQTPEHPRFIKDAVKLRPSGQRYKAFAHFHGQFPLQLCRTDPCDSY